MSDTHSNSNPSSMEQSLDQSEFLQVPVLLSPDCNGTTFHLSDSCYDDTPLTSHYHGDNDEDEVEEVNIGGNFLHYMYSGKIDTEINIVLFSIKDIELFKQLLESMSCNQSV